MNASAESQKSPFRQPPTIARHGFRAKLVAWVWTFALRLLYVTWRTDLESLDHLDEMIERGHGTMVSFWHGKYVPLFVLLGGRSARIFASQSFRGNVIAEICRHFGYRCVQIPIHDRKRALDMMRQALTAPPHVGAIAVDGPLGPYHVVKHGAVRLASELGFAFLPVSVGARRRWTLHRRWDHMQIPKLFTRVSLVVGERIPLPSSLSSGDIAKWSDLIRDALEAVDHRAEQRARAGRASVIS